MANSARGVMKISTAGIDKAEPITTRIAKVAGQKYDTISDLKGVVHLDKLDDSRAVILVKNEAGNLNLETIALP
jgi:hypothetical protein